MIGGVLRPPPVLVRVPESMDNMLIISVASPPTCTFICHSFVMIRMGFAQQMLQMFAHGGDTHNI